MLIQKNLSISQKQQTYRPLTYRSSSTVFMMNNTPSGAKKHRESTEPESRQITAERFFFISSSSSNGLVQIYVTLSRWFLDKTAAFSTEQCTNSSLFSRFEVS